MTDGRNVIVTMEVLKMSAVVGRWVCILCSVDSQVQAANVDMLGEDALAVVLPQALSQMSHAVQSAQSILDPEVRKQEHSREFRDMVLKATRDVRVRYASSLSKLVQTQQASNIETLQNMMTGIAVAEPLAELTALEVDNVEAEDHPGQKTWHSEARKSGRLAGARLSFQRGGREAQRSQ